ncbi:DUF4136 domain-containing protein [Hymenobacter sp. BT186]|uniref:DUF4136 domain-containing protein n=1 Tax=Hymenobacter telluris TaxID=2816474 RepID=A0A939EU10_9BACT|nr:DUF4136 domain-containing protein [Hymenobacter telluris]MBO0357408.1 DUF4136 domain-containing protein [Hymenobacter telluris]MBW3373434.1 DUF4136 domain-containing protein [Hymenobacter norwichensis]
MKLLSTLFVGSTLALALSGCFAAREARIESDYSYAGAFRRYRTYEFVTGDGLAADSSKLGEVLRDAIRTRMKVQGYKPSKRRPDLLVNFRVYEGDMRFRGYAQEDIARWVNAEKIEDDETPAEQRTGYQPVRMLLAEGTLLITLIDNRTNRAVWNGYASGVTVPNGTQGELVLRRSVRSIFDQYRVFTQGYLEGNNQESGE